MVVQVTFENYRLGPQGTSGIHSIHIHAWLICFPLVRRNDKCSTKTTDWACQDPIGTWLELGTVSGYTLLFPVSFGDVFKHHKSWMLSLSLWVRTSLRQSSPLGISNCIAQFQCKNFRPNLIFLLQNLHKVEEKDNSVRYPSVFQPLQESMKKSFQAAVSYTISVDTPHFPMDARQTPNHTVLCALD